MARRKKSKKWNWQDNWASFVVGAIVVIILGLLVANLITNKGGMIDGGGKVDLTKQDQGNNEPEQYKVQANDSLSAISEKFYGDQSYWPVLAGVNKISNPDIIFVEATLQIPAKEKVQAIRTQMTETSYKVEEGDTLFKIAEMVYQDGSKWILLDKANNVGRLPNGNPLIFTGSTLTIPR